MEIIKKVKFMLINCKNIISSPNEDCTVKIVLSGVQFKIKEAPIEGTIIFPRVYPSQTGLFEVLSEKEDSEMLTVIIPG